MKTEKGEWRAKVLAVATSPNRIPHIPDLPGLQEFPGLSMHTFEYKDAKQAEWGEDVVVVGCGNSAMEVISSID